MRIKFLGHSGFLVDDLVLDPFITGNPVAKDKPDEIKCKVVCITHAHDDHLSDAIKIAKANDATVVCAFEIAQEISKEGVKAEGINFGGTIKVHDWEIKMEMAVHDCPKSAPCSFILKKNGKVIYYAGDTAYFLDMTRFKDYNIDIAFVPIGDRFTMGISDAVKCVKSVGCKIAVPMHYRTFPILEQSAADFIKGCDIKVVEFRVGEVKEI